ncbi:MAG: hypothetical protein ACYDB3_06630, partial [Acidimicrobiales bacterium]
MKRLAKLVSDTVDWKVTVVFGPAGAFATELTLGGSNIFEEETASIHSATGEKCAVSANVPMTATVIDPMLPAGPAGPGAAADAPAPAAVVGAPVEVPLKVVMLKPAGAIESS